MKKTAEFAKRQGRKAPKSVLQHYCISSLRLSRCKHSDYFDALSFLFWLVKPDVLRSLLSLIGAQASKLGALPCLPISTALTRACSFASKPFRTTPILVSAVVAANTAIFSGTTSHTPSSNTWRCFPTLPVPPWSRWRTGLYGWQALWAGSMPMNSDVPTMKSTTLPMADTMDEYRRSGKGFRGEEDNSLLRRYKQGEHPQMTTPPAYVWLKWRQRRHGGRRLPIETRVIIVGCARFVRRGYPCICSSWHWTAKIHWTRFDGHRDKDERYFCTLYRHMPFLRRI